MNEEILEEKYCVLTLYGSRSIFKRIFLYKGTKKELKLKNKLIDIDAKNIIKEEGYPLLWTPPVAALQDGNLSANSIREYVMIEEVNIREFPERDAADIYYMFLS